MDEVHGIEIIPCDLIWEAIKEFYAYENKKQKKKKGPIKKAKREVFLQRWRPVLHEALKSTEDSFNRIYLNVC